VISGRLLGGPGSSFFKWVAGDVKKDSIEFVAGGITAIRAVNTDGGPIVAEFVSER
jgi:hypothetical protein